MPDAGRTAQGVLLAGILAIDPDERVTAMVAVPDFDEARYVMMITKQGTCEAHLAQRVRFGPPQRLDRYPPL